MTKAEIDKLLLSIERDMRMRRQFTVVDPDPRQWPGGPPIPLVPFSVRLEALHIGDHGTYLNGRSAYPH